MYSSVTNNDQSQWLKTFFNHETAEGSVPHCHHILYDGSATMWNSVVHCNIRKREQGETCNKSLSFHPVLLHNFSSHILLAKTNLIVLPWEKKLYGIILWLPVS